MFRGQPRAFGHCGQFGPHNDDPGNNDFAVRQVDPLEQGPLMHMARVRDLERDRRRPRCEGDIDDLGERHVAMVRSLGIGGMI